MALISRHAGLAWALALLTSCTDTLPTAPSEPTSGITIYEHANFGGESALVTGDVRDLKDYSGGCEYQEWSGDTYMTLSSWNDCISSIRVAPGWHAIVYVDGDFKGDSLDITADAPNLQLVPGSCPHGGFNDCITSIRGLRQ